MSEADTSMLDAALRVFCRYGVKRSSMSDLCEEAGVSRQTLYNRFRNKDDILRALIRHYTDTAIAEINQGVWAEPDLGAKLDLVFDRMVVRGYDKIQAMPNAQDFIEGINASSRDELDRSAERFREVIETIFAPHEQALARSGLTVAALSHFVQHAAKAAGSGARDRPQLMSQLATLRQLCLNAAFSTPPKARAAEGCRAPDN